MTPEEIERFWIACDREELSGQPPDLNSVFDALEWFCGKHALRYRLESGFQGMTREGGEYKEKPERFMFAIWGASIRVVSRGVRERVYETGVTIQEAIIKAVLAAQPTDRKETL